ncbi:MAG TPA: ABC transporter [Marmoricola sp.]|nr:ABC transporter [Marmoricola sp.]
MTALLEGARRLVGRRTDLDARIAGLADAVEATRGRLDDDLVDRAADVVERASARLRLSAEHTVVALAGATGSGKSSTFNRLTGLDLAAVGVRRPTTSWATACIWGSAGAEDLLAWLGVPPRHQVSRDSMLDSAPGAAPGAGSGTGFGTEAETDPESEPALEPDSESDSRPDPGTERRSLFGRSRRDELQGLVLLDLPDHDSTEVSHHLEVERLVRLADLMVWVLDPQKYADAAIHDRFLKPLAHHKDVMLVVLNHVDEVPVDRRESLLADIGRLLAQDGLAGVPVIATSARTGEGIPELRAAIARQVRAKAATRTRFGQDVTDAAARLADANGSAKPPTVDDRDSAELVDAVADAAGVPVVVDAVERASAARARRATGWPVTAWLGRLRPDPLRRLHLDLGRGGRDLVANARASLPPPDHVQRARVESAVRGLADEVSADLTPGWVEAVRRASTSRAADLEDRLDRAVGSADLGVGTVPWWCRAVRVLQWLLLLAAVGGGLWLAALAVLGYLQVPQPATPRVLGLPLPTLMLVGGVAVGIVLALVSRVLVGIGARARARRARRRLLAAMAELTDELLLEPVRVELAAYARAVDGLARARG